MRWPVAPVAPTMSISSPMREITAYLAPCAEKAKSAVRSAMARLFMDFIPRGNHIECPRQRRFDSACGRSINTAKASGGAQKTRHDLWSVGFFVFGHERYRFTFGRGSLAAEGRLPRAPHPQGGKDARLVRARL